MFERLRATRKSGQEQFTQGETALGFTVGDFWQWSSSDLVGNALRGLVAEFLVARALGVDGGVRTEWEPYDVATASGFRIEVKSSSYLQSWAQRTESAISFDIRETLAWDPEANAFSPESERRRQAHLYVFALLAHRTKATLNPLNVLQWEFYLLPAAVLNEHAKEQRRISLSRLIALHAVRCSYAELRQTIAEMERKVRQERANAALTGASGPEQGSPGASG
jgi:hypothetical protein